MQTTEIELAEKILDCDGNSWVSSSLIRFPDAHLSRENTKHIISWDVPLGNLGHRQKDRWTSRETIQILVRDFYYRALSKMLIFRGRVWSWRNAQIYMSLSVSTPWSPLIFLTKFLCKIKHDYEISYPFEWSKIFGVTLLKSPCWQGWQNAKNATRCWDYASSRIWLCNDYFGNTQLWSFQ